MGDCRIRIVIAKSLLLSDEVRIVLADQDGGDGDHNVSSSNDTSVSFVYIYAADTTIREVTEGNFILRKIFFDSSKEIIANNDDDGGRKLFTLWDCTYHPPKDITSWPKYDFPDLQGMKSKTLHTAGMFPSGTWIVVPKGITPNKLQSDSNAYVDIQYNNVNNNKNVGSSDGSEKAMKVEFQDPNLRSNNGNNNNNTNNPPLPSQVMESVTNRFQPEDIEEFNKKLNESDIIALRRKNLQHRKRRERERVTKLDRKIEILEEQSSSSESCSSSKKKKTKKVSDQVLRMLVKSRATGEKSLKQQDRIYFQCLVFLDDDNNSKIDNDNNNSNDSTSMTNSNNNSNNNNNSKGDVDTAASATKESILSKEYRYFSPQDTFAKIANSFPNHHGYLSEVLCRRQRPAAGDGLVADESSSLLTHRCFPVSIRIYEAISQGCLSNNDKKIDTLIIRWYRDRDNATPSIIEDKIEDEEMIEADESNNNNNGTTTSTISDEQITTDATTITTPETMTPMQADEEIKSVAINDTSAFFEDTCISSIIQEMDNLNRKGKKATTKKPLSAVATKLRQMKSKGNKKIKIEDKIFLNVVTIISETTEEDNAMAISEDIFMSRSEPIERILRYASTTTGKNSTTTTTRNVEDWIFLVPQQKDSSSQHYREITTTSICIQEAEEFLDEKFSPFDRLILRRKNS
jgi:hypothetical protein